jgi:O-methyltransferase
MHTSELFKQAPHPSSVSDYYHCFNSSNILNVIYWWEYFQKTSGVDGDIVECGVGRGRSLITLMSINSLMTNLKTDYSKKIYALDSFQGFPDPSEKDISSRNPKKGEWSESPNQQFKYSPKSLKKVIELADLDDEVEIVKGFFDKTTVSLSVDKIAILHLDGDLYESLLTPLNNLWHKISIGGVVVVDDFLSDEQFKVNEAFPGARKAITEFMKMNDCFEYLVSIRGTPYLKRVK